MIIQPYGKKIQIQIEQPTVGGLDISAKESGVEVAKVLITAKIHIEGIGDFEFKENDKIMVKAWAIDIITYEGTKYYFVDYDSEGICAMIKD